MNPSATFHHRKTVSQDRRETTSDVGAIRRFGQPRSQPQTRLWQTYMRVKSARRNWTSLRMYQRVMRYAHEGKNPASRTPNNARRAASWFQVLTNPAAMLMHPQRKTIVERKSLGLALRRKTLAGISNNLEWVY